MPTTTLENPALPNLHRLFEAINPGDLSVIPDAVTDDFVDHGSPVPLPPGPDGYAQILGFVTQVLDIEYQIQDLFCTDDRICVRAVAHGRAVAAVHGRPPPASRTRWTACTSTGPKGDRLAEHWGVRDEFGVLVQVGVIAPPQLPVP